LNFVVALFRTVARCPLVLLHGAGWCVGWITFLSSPRYRRRLLANARQAGYGWRVARSAVGEAGKMALEIPRLWLGAPVPLRWDGAELIEAAQASGQGVLFMTPHMGCFEVTAQAYAERFGSQRPMTVLFRPARQPWLRELMAQSRQRPGLLTAPTSLAGVKQLIKALKAGDTVGLLPDQVPPAGQGVWAPFFGREAYTMTLSARLVHSGQARLLFAWGERLPWGQGYVVRVRGLEKLLDGALEDDPGLAAAQINRAMERLVAEQPAQYLWSYNRYKAPA